MFSKWRISSVIMSWSVCTQLRSSLGFVWREWCWSWNSSTLATSSEELTHWKRLWCWEGLGAGEGDDRGWDGWMASPTQWTWVWVNSGNWWWTGRPGVLRFMGSQRVRHDWATALNWIMANLFRWPPLTEEPTKSHFIWIKGTAFTQEIAKVLGALCQDPGSEIQYYH